MNHTHELAAIEAHIEDLARGGHLRGVMAEALRSRLNAMRPTVPFDLEPSRLMPPTIYTTTQAESHYGLLAQYDAVHKWHELSRRLSDLTSR